jgi:hypothetical protein
MSTPATGPQRPAAAAFADAAARAFADADRADADALAATLVDACAAAPALAAAARARARADAAARALTGALVRYGHPAVAPVPGEMEELAAWLEQCRDRLHPVHDSDDIEQFDRIVILLQQLTAPTPIVPPELIRALELAEAGLSDIGDADREPGDDLAWAEARAARDLPRIRQALNLWRDQAAAGSYAGLRNALRQIITLCDGLATDEVSDEFLCRAPGEVKALLKKLNFARAATPAVPRPEGDWFTVAMVAQDMRSRGLADQACGEELLKLANSNRSQPARLDRPAVAPVAVSERPWEIEGWCDAEGRCWIGEPEQDYPLDETGDFDISPAEWKLTDPTIFFSAARLVVLLPHWAIYLPTITQEPQP